MKVLFCKKKAVNKVRTVEMLHQMVMIFWPDHPALLISSCLLLQIFHLIDGAATKAEAQEGIPISTQHFVFHTIILGKDSLKKTKKQQLRNANSFIKFSFLKTFPALEFSRSKCMHVVFDNAYAFQ